MITLLLSCITFFFLLILRKIGIYPLSFFKKKEKILRIAGEIIKINHNELEIKQEDGIIALIEFNNTDLFEKFNFKINNKVNIPCYAS